MKFLSKILMAIMILPLYTTCSAQIRNATTEMVSVYGNCGACEATIEKAGNLKNVSKVDWDKDTQMATLTYDAKKTNQEEILKKIALVGYDSDHFLAPDDTYANLPACCQYERVNKTPEMSMEETVVNTSSAFETPKMEMKMEESVVQTPTTPEIPNMEVRKEESRVETTERSETPNMEMSMGEKVVKTPAKSETLTTNKNMDTKVETVQHQEVNLLAAVFSAYFEVKDALVQTDAVLTATKASALLSAINTVKMENLPMDVHMVWMKILNGLKQDVNAIADSKNVETQRSHFINLSKNMYDLIKVANYETPVYYQFCPMANDGKGANWLSKENVVKNPYYGTMMLSCGKVVETIE